MPVDLLDKLDFGLGAAQQEQQLKQYFYRSGSFKLACSEKTYLILGAKGAGKSAIFRMFRELEREISIFALPNLWISDEPLLRDHWATLQKIGLQSQVTLWRFYMATIQNLSLRSTLTREELRRSLAIKCGATEGDANALGFLIDFIVYTNLATAEENGAITRGNFDEIASKPETTVRPELAVKSDQPEIVEAKTPGSSKEDKKSASVVVHFHVHDFTHLTPENAEALRKWVKLVNQEGLSVDFELSTENQSSEKP